VKKNTKGRMAMLLSYRALSYLTLSILFYFILFFSSLRGTYKGILISNNKFAQEGRSNPNLLFSFFSIQV
jgi:hypothetical protein